MAPGKFLMMGSCFSTEVGKRMQEDGYQVLLNPFGILFNPASICASLERLESVQPFREEDVIERDGQFCSFHHHGSFRRPTPEAFLADANASLYAAAQWFSAARTIVLTFGTAWVFRHLERNLIVSNCHKVPAREFRRERLTVSQTVAMLSPFVERHPEKEWILTVSPIRHMADGLHGNQVSKSTLILACDEMESRYPNVTYFPSYEIMMDQLRDYRWYADNQTHPTDEAVDVIYGEFGKLINI